MLPADAGAPTPWPRLRGELARLTARRLAVVNDLLREMVKAESAELGEALTINGLMAELPAVGDGQAGRLAGAEAMDQAVSRSLAWFAGELAGMWNSAGRDQKARRALPQRIEALCGQWRGRLATIARTVVHAVFNRTRLEVSGRLASAA